MKILRRLDKYKITFKAIEKYQYGLKKTVSKHLKTCYKYTAEAKLATKKKQTMLWLSYRKPCHFKTTTNPTS